MRIALKFKNGLERAAAGTQIGKVLRKQTRRHPELPISKSIEAWLQSNGG